MPRDEDITSQDIAISADGFLARLPAEVRSTFTEEQIAAINQAVQRVKNSVDARATLPLPWGRRISVLLSGNEGSSAEDSDGDRQASPLSTAAKGAVALIYIGIAGFLAVSGYQIYSELASNLLR